MAFGEVFDVDPFSLETISLEIQKAKFQQALTIALLLQNVARFQLLLKRAIFRRNHKLQVV